MNEREQKIRALEAEMLMMMGIVAQVFRHLAEISPQHQAAVRDGFDVVFRTLSQAHEYALGADARFMFDYAVSCVDTHRLLALAPRAGANSGARTDAVKGARTRAAIRR